MGFNYSGRLTVALKQAPAELSISTVPETLKKRCAREKFNKIMDIFEIWHLRN